MESIYLISFIFCNIFVGLLGTLTKSQIILAGDPKQLGPVLQSPISKMYGLEMSLLERLSQLPLYQRNSSRFQDHYDPMLVTKLGLCFFFKPKLKFLILLNVTFIWVDDAVKRMNGGKGSFCDVAVLFINLIDREIFKTHCK